MLPVDGESKEPLCAWRAFTERLPDAFDIHNWTMRFPKAGIAVITGPISDLLVLDADGPDAIAEIERRGIPKTPMVRTPGNPAKGRPEGLHCYFKHPKDLPPFKSSTKLGDSKKLDVRGAGSYVVAPYTRRRDGRAYRWIAHPDRTPLAYPPAWFLGMLKAAAKDHPAPHCGGPVGQSTSSGSSSKPTHKGPTRPPQRGVEALVEGLPPRLKGLIEQVLYKPYRSERDFDAVVGMLANGLNEEMIESIFDAYPVGDKYRDDGQRYLERTISLAYDCVKVVHIKYADMNSYSSRMTDGTDHRLQLCFEVEDGGALIRCGITVPSGVEDGAERWIKFFEAVGLAPPFGERALSVGQRLIGRKLRLEVDNRGRRQNPVAAFYKIQE
jgi:hypothetical protein